MIEMQTVVSSLGHVVTNRTELHRNLGCRPSTLTQDLVLSKMAAFLLATTVLGVGRAKERDKKDSSHGGNIPLTLPCMMKSGRDLSCWAWGVKGHVGPAGLVKLTL